MFIIDGLLSGEEVNDFCHLVRQPRSQKDGRGCAKKFVDNLPLQAKYLLTEMVKRMQDCLGEVLKKTCEVAPFGKQW